jgi:sugar phosphate isomerase/epimerase
MRLGCAAYSYRELLQSGALSLEQFVDLCAEMGLDGVELTSYYFPSTEPEYLHRLKQHCFQRGMHILATAVGSNFTQADDAKREAHVQMTRDWIDHSVTLGSPCLRIFAGPVPEGMTEQEAYARALECIRTVTAYGAERGVTLALENHGGVTGTAAQVQRFLDAVDSPWLGVNLDFGNFRQDPYAEFAQLAPRTVTTHAKLTSRFGDGHGEVDYSRVRAILEDAGYRGYISIEFEEREDPRVAVPRFVEELAAAFR